MLDDLRLTGVTIIGNSVGGWIAAEIALLGSPQINGLVLIDYRPDAFRLDLDHLPDRQRAMMAANRIALQVYAGARG